MSELLEQLQFVLDHSRKICIEQGFNPDKASFSTAKEGDSIFKGMAKADVPREYDFLAEGTVRIVLISREYDEVTFLGTNLGDAIGKAFMRVRDDS
jgi:hypothetical protein